jgi:2-(1,2-epoxy-1,2-dihydrophenyl)acetyl-CoA isomerase
MADVEVDRVGAVLVIRLNRPDSLNALTWEALAGIRDAATVVSDDRDVGAILITGAGRGFCSGVDLRVASAVRPGVSMLREGFHPAISSLLGAGVPIVTAVNGVVAGAGLAFALAGDIRIGCDRSRFVPSFIDQGLAPDAGSTYFARDRIGVSRATEYFIAGNAVDAGTARSWGLLTQIVPESTLLDEAIAVAERLAVAPRDASRSTVALMREGMLDALGRALDREAGAQELLARAPETLALLDAQRERVLNRARSS